MKTLFSLLYWTFLCVSSMILFLGALLIWAATAPFDPARGLLHRYTCWWAAIYVRCLPGCRMTVEGREKIQPHTPYVFVANHQSQTDIMALSALAVPFKWVSKKEVFRLPCVGWNMYLNNYVNVDRGNLRKVAGTMDECRHWLRLGVPLMMFPEGHRSPDGAMQKFHGGAFKLAVDSGCAVVPIVVDGTHGIYKGLRVSPPKRIAIRVLDPIALADVDGRAGKLRDEAAKRMHQALAELRGQVRTLVS